MRKKGSPTYWNALQAFQCYAGAPDSVKKLLVNGGYTCLASIRAKKIP
ncbi:MAG: hypothetical protein LBJ59_11625 [Zoogloeaceae bacterium]|jgi:hypothetical protein|nr:hypothetical protein [Zoogloeaceae bacterium]